MAAVRKVEGRDAELLFPDTQGGPARDRRSVAGRAREQFGDKRRGGHELLEVIEDKQQLALAQEILRYPLHEVMRSESPGRRVRKR